MAFRLLSVTQIVRTDRPPRPAAQTKCYVSKIIILAERYKRIVNQTQPSSTIYRLLSSPALGRCCRLPSCPVRPGISTPSAVTPVAPGHLAAVCCHARLDRASRSCVAVWGGTRLWFCGMGVASSSVLRREDEIRPSCCGVGVDARRMGAPLGACRGRISAEFAVFWTRKGWHR